MIKYFRGNTIIEVLIAATMISIAILAALSLSSNSQKQTDFSRDLHLASTYNDQTLDWLRNMRTLLGWYEFIDAISADGSGTVTYCLTTLPATSSEFLSLTAGSCAGALIPGTNLSRDLSLTPQGSPIDSVYALVTTSWAGGQHSSFAETTLTKWY